MSNQSSRQAKANVKARKAKAKAAEAKMRNSYARTKAAKYAQQAASRQLRQTLSGGIFARAMMPEMLLGTRVDDRSPEACEARERALCRLMGEPYRP